MFILSLITLAIASTSAFVSLNAKEEVFKVAMAGLAIVSVFLTLVLAPWELKLILATIPFFKVGSRWRSPSLGRKAEFES
jgi:hypothetical protein